MTPQQWQAVGEIFDQAVLLPPGERTALVDRACGSDEELRGEIASLLASHQAAGGFLQDRLRDDAHHAIHHLRHAGVKRTMMLTGDRERIARIILEGRESF